MRLVNKKTGESLLEFKGDKIQFFNRFLEEEMRIVGIPIPPGVRNYFGGKDYIFLDDENFQRAFREIYYLTSFDPKLFQWQ